MYFCYPVSLIMHTFNHKFQDISCCYLLVNLVLLLSALDCLQNNQKEVPHCENMKFDYIWRYIWCKSLPTSLFCLFLSVFQILLCMDFTMPYTMEMNIRCCFTFCHCLWLQPFSFGGVNLYSWFMGMTGLVWYCPKLLHYSMVKTYQKLTLQLLMMYLASLLSGSFDVLACYQNILLSCILNEIFQDKNGNIVLKHREALIHTDGTGLISEDLAKKCPTDVFKGNLLRIHDVSVCLHVPHIEFMLRPVAPKVQTDGERRAIYFNTPLCILSENMIFLFLNYHI